MDTLAKMKEDGKWDSPLGPLIKVLQTSKSLFAIGNVCVFINTLIECQ